MKGGLSRNPTPWYLMMIKIVLKNYEELLNQSTKKEQVKVLEKKVRSRSSESRSFQSLEGLIEITNKKLP